MITADIATNLLAAALWEVAIVPLYRGTRALWARPDAQRGELGKAIDEAAEGLARASAAHAVPSTVWRSFFERADVQSIVRDVYAFRLSEQASFDEVRVAFEALWHEFEELDGTSYDIDVAEIFDRLVDAIGLVLAAAIEKNVLSAHEAKSAARNRILADRLDAIQRQLDALSNPKRLSASELDRFEAQLRSEVGDRHRKIEPPSLQGRDPVPIDSLYVDPRLRPTDSSRTVTLEEFLAATVRRVVLGHPGAGKSTLTSKICVLLCDEHEETLVAGRTRTPWRIELRRYGVAHDKEPLSLLEYFDLHARKNLQLSVPEGAFEQLLDEERLLVIFDGLDELLSADRRAEVRNDVESFCRRFPDTPVLITCRHIEYRNTPVDDDLFDTVDLDEFGDRQIEQYVGKWFERDISLTPDERVDKAAAFLTESNLVPDLRRNPLMLALLCAFYRGRSFIPNNLADVYGNCAQLLFDTWDRSRGISVGLSFAEHVRPALNDMAYWIVNEPALASAGVTRRQAVQRTADFLKQRRFGDEDRARAAAEEFIDYCRGRAWVFSDHSLTQSGEDLFNFTHRTFLEYFAGEWLAATNATPKLLVEALFDNVVSGDMDVVTRVAMQIKARSLLDGADGVFGELLERSQQCPNVQQRHVIRFLLQSLSSLVPSPRIAQELAERTIAVVARSPHSEVPLLVDLANTGPELADELVDGAADAVIDLLRSAPAEIAWVAADIALNFSLSYTADASTRSFWKEVGDLALERGGDEFRRLSRRDWRVAREYSWATRDLGLLLDRHGLSYMFAFCPSVVPGLGNLPMAPKLLVEALLLGSADGIDAALAVVAKAAREEPAPWTKGTVMHRQAFRRLEYPRSVAPSAEIVLSPDAWMGLWALAAATSEIGGAKPVMDLLPRSPRSTSDQEPVGLGPLTGLAEVVATRGRVSVRPLEEALAAIPIDDEDRAQIRSWSLGEISFVDQLPAQA